MKTNELKALLERATKGPWYAKQTRGNNIYEHTVTNAPNGYLEICQLLPDPDTKRSDDIGQATMITANADLIAIAPYLAAELIRCRELLAGMVAGAFNDEATELEHTLDCPVEGCTLCEAKKYLQETE